MYILYGGGGGGGWPPWCCCIDPGGGGKNVPPGVALAPIGGGGGGGGGGGTEEDMGLGVAFPPLLFDALALPARPVGGGFVDDGWLLLLVAVDGWLVGWLVVGRCCWASVASGGVSGCCGCLVVSAEPAAVAGAAAAAEVLAAVGVAAAAAAVALAYEVAGFPPKILRTACCQMLISLCLTSGLSSTSTAPFCTPRITREMLEELATRTTGSWHLSMDVSCSSAASDPSKNNAAANIATS
mmetsp:Transcript_14799/g.39208  ORF Transcript_14799/g.39208 Transcript_14799/m.39208 type:complete len:240 (-) Transcript_14799:769-1488(-)